MFDGGFVLIQLYQLIRKNILLKNEFVMINQSSFFFLIFSFILLSRLITVLILRNKVEKNIRNLIRNIIILPAIPLFWKWGFEINLENQAPNIIYSFYSPLFFSIFIVVILLISIIRYYINKRRNLLKKDEKNAEW